MAKYEGFNAILTLVLIGIGIITLVMLIPSMLFTFKLILIGLPIAFLVVISLWYFLSYVKKHEVNAETILDIRPLSHYRGFPVPPSPAIKRVNPDGSITIIGKNDSRTTTEDVQFLAPSQLLAVWYGKLDEEKSEFIAKFGVVRVRAVNGDLKNCNVKVRYRITEEMGSLNNIPKWYDGGYLNWFSPPIKQKFGNYNLLGKINSGINEYLKNGKVDIYQGEENDILLFYIIKNSPAIHLRSDFDFSVIGYANDEKMPLKVELELHIAGEGFRSIVKGFRASAVWDDFCIEEISS